MEEGLDALAKILGRSIDEKRIGVVKGLFLFSRRVLIMGLLTLQEEPCVRKRAGVILEIVFNCGRVGGRPVGSDAGQDASAARVNVGEATEYHISDRLYTSLHVHFQ